VAVSPKNVCKSSERKEKNAMSNILSFIIDFRFEGLYGLGGTLELEIELGLGSR